MNKLDTDYDWTTLEGLDWLEERWVIQSKAFLEESYVSDMITETEKDDEGYIEFSSMYYELIVTK